MSLYCGEISCEDQMSTRFDNHVTCHVESLIEKRLLLLELKLFVSLSNSQRSCLVMLVVFWGYMVTVIKLNFIYAVCSVSSSEGEEVSELW